MTLTLYHYVHCPFCVRVRMALGYLDLEYQSKVLAYDDEKTPLKLTGKKMLPILSHEQGSMNESLDIISFIDKANKLNVKEIIGTEEFKEIEFFLEKIRNPVHSLAMPYWIYTAEFSPDARKYFLQQKESKRGPFKDLVSNQKEFIQELMPLLDTLEKHLHPFYNSENITLKDILVASHLWGLYVVPEFQFPQKIHAYLQSVKTICHFNYHQDYWT